MNNEKFNGGEAHESNNDFKEPIFFDDSELNGAYKSPESTPEEHFDEARAKRHFSRIGFGYAAFSLITLLVSYMLVQLVRSSFPSFYGSLLFNNILTPVALYLFALPVLLIVLSGCESSAPAKRKMGLGSMILCFIVSIGLMYIGNMIGNNVMSELSELMNYDYSNGLVSLIDADNIWLTALFTVVVAPIGEEFVFRKLIIDRTQKYGGYVCIILSASMFALMHGNLYQLFYAFAIGLVLGYVYYKTGNIIYTVVLHAAVNFMGSVVSQYISAVMTSLLEAMESGDRQIMASFVGNNYVGILLMLAFVFFVYGSMICAVVLPMALHKKIKIERGSEAIPRGKTLGIVLANAGIIVMLSVYAAELLMALLPL